MLEKIAAYKALVESQNPTAPIRMALSDSDAVALVEELAAGEGVPQHADQVSAAAVEMKALLAEELPTEADALQSWAERKGAISRSLWDGLTGSIVGGVEIIRKR